MFLGKAVFHIRLFGVSSLKDKRRVLESLLTRLRQKMGVSCAEIGENEIWGRSVIGVACVSSSEAHARDILEKCLSFIESNIDGEVLSADMEVMT